MRASPGGITWSCFDERNKSWEYRSTEQNNLGDFQKKIALKTVLLCIILFKVTQHAFSFVFPTGPLAY